MKMLAGCWATIISSSANGRLSLKSQTFHLTCGLSSSSVSSAPP
nr:MAG TPA: hypothetical protein [Caudoviricetes sp.]